MQLWKGSERGMDTSYGFRLNLPNGHFILFATESECMEYISDHEEEFKD